MATLIKDAMKNLAMDEVVNRTIQVRAHTNDPGTNGTANSGSGNGITNADINAAGWTVAASGAVENSGTVSMGTLAAGQADRTINHISLFAGTTHLANIQLTNAITLSAGDSLSIPSGGIDLTAT